MQCSRTQFVNISFPVYTHALVGSILQSQSLKCHLKADNSETSLLTFRLMYPAPYPTSLLGYPIDISNPACPNPNSPPSELDYFRLHITQHTHTLKIPRHRCRQTRTCMAAVLIRDLLLVSCCLSVCSLFLSVGGRNGMVLLLSFKETS